MTDALPFGLHAEPGWVGFFTRDSAPGAWPPGTRVIKVMCEKGDTHPNGTKGTVLGSLTDSGYLAYFIEWDVRPRVAVSCMDFKLAVLA